jgi:hypothetical protein
LSTKLSNKTIFTKNKIYIKYIQNILNNTFIVIESSKEQENKRIVATTEKKEDL